MQIRNAEYKRLSKDKTEVPAFNVLFYKKDDIV